jgi:hypothetical protein
MSKCQARKFLAGGRCGGSSSVCPITKPDTQGTNASFQNLLAQREAMDAKMWSAPEKPQVQTALVVVEQKQNTKQQQKEIDISCILGNDFE